MRIYKDVESFQNIKEMLTTRASTHKDNIAIHQKNLDQTYKEITFGELKADVDALGTSLLSLGLRGKNIAITGKNSYEWIVAYFAVVCGAGVIVPLDKQLTESELKSNINRINIDAIFYADDLKDKINNISQDINIKQYINFNDISELIAKGKEAIAKRENKYTGIKIDNDALAALIFTSGTMALPKIVMQSNKNMMSVVKAGRQMVHFDEEDKFFSVLPLNHTFESVCGLLAPLASGSSINYINNNANIAKDIKTASPTAMAAVPQVAETFYKKIVEGIEKENKVTKVKIAMALLNLLGKKSYSIKRTAFKAVHDQFGGKLRLLILGGAPLNQKITKYFFGLGIQTVQGYGLTECSPLVTLNGDYKSNAKTAGVATPGTTVKIDNPNRFGVGEILVKGPQVTAGYYDNSEATKELLAGGYLHTGDLGKTTPRGFVEILGRMKNLIITSNGENVSPEEIENIINNVKGVKESRVYQQTTPKGHQKIAALVVINDALKGQIKLNPASSLEIYKEIRVHLEQANKSMAPFKRVDNFNITEEDLEKTSTQKIKRPNYTTDLVQS